MKINKDLALLMNKGVLEKILLKHAEELKLSNNLQLLEIKRVLVLAPESYVLAITVSDNGQNKIIRGNASEKDSRRNSYDTLMWLNKNHFADEQCKVINNFAYDEDYNLFLYPNIEGEVFINQLGQPLENLIPKVKMAGQWLRKLHSLKSDGIEHSYYQFNINYNHLDSKYKIDSKEVNLLIEKIVPKNKLIIHGDYQPNNIIINNQEIWVFDFNDSVRDDPLIDVASFTTQLRIMLLRFGNPDHFAVLAKEFMKEYQKNRPLNNILSSDLQIYKKLFYLKILASLSASLQDDEPNKKDILAKIYQYWRQEDDA